MNKLKTNKAVAKRIRFTRRGKMIRRVTRQDHFNAKASGTRTQAKRRTRTVKKQDMKSLAAYLTY